jgi:L-seryl-tRNA(Ser) seleniumtransferase
MVKTEVLRAIPSVDAVLRWPQVQELIERIGHRMLVETIRGVIEEVRREVLEGRVFSDADHLRGEIENRLLRFCEKLQRPSLRPVINATGVIIHTNLGRAPLASEALSALEQIGARYCNLEYDIEGGHRGDRDVHCQEVLRQLLGAEAAVVVNNNAAAVFLVLNTLADGGEVIVSRGELVEIGGSFRLPEIMEKSGAVLREVGTTNRTRLADYRRALSERTRLILRVHRSNFRLVGFTEQPDLAELVALAHEHGLPCFEDLGSGCLIDLSPWGIRDEPTVAHSLTVGVDLCSFSGDKLLSGPQAGVIVGRASLIEKIKRNPLMRAVRPDKLTLAALEATLRAYLRGRPDQDVPVLRMIAQPAATIRRRAQRFVGRARRACGPHLRFSLHPGYSVTGGGSAPEVRLETTLVAVEADDTSATELERKLRSAHPPIIARIQDDRLVFDLRTVQPDEEAILIEVLRRF